MKNQISSLPFKVLLIENEATVTTQIKQWLHEYAEITHADDGITGATLVQKGEWNLVIADMEVMGLTALELIKLAKLANPWLSVLLLTSYQKIESTVLVLQNHEHADGVLFKPLEKTKFLELTLKLAQEAKSRRQKEQKVILAIGSHPDDVEIGSAGSLARHYAEGARINILTLSLGGVGGKKSVRSKEAQQAAEILHAKLFLGSFSDTRIPEGIKTIQFIEEIVQEVKPTHIYTHSLHDNHQDHRNTHLASIVASRIVPNLYCYQSPSCTIDFKPNLFIDISDYLDQKIKATSIHRSQSQERSYLNEELIRASAIYWGRFANYCLAEPMEVVRQQYR